MAAGFPVYKPSRLHGLIVTKSLCITLLSLSIKYSEKVQKLVSHVLLEYFRKTGTSGCCILLIKLNVCSGNWPISCTDHTTRRKRRWWSKQRLWNAREDSVRCYIRSAEARRLHYLVIFETWAFSKSAHQQKTRDYDFRGMSMLKNCASTTGKRFFNQDLVLFEINVCSKSMLQQKGKIWCFSRYEYSQNLRINKRDVSINILWFSRYMLKICASTKGKTACGFLGMCMHTICASAKGNHNLGIFETWVCSKSAHQPIWAHVSITWAIKWETPFSHGGRHVKVRLRLNLTLTSYVKIIPSRN